MILCSGSGKNELRFVPPIAIGAIGMRLLNVGGDSSGRYVVGGLSSLII
jgi:hypothetical protein